MDEKTQVDLGASAAQAADLAEAGRSSGQPGARPALEGASSRPRSEPDGFAHGRVLLVDRERLFEERERQLELARLELLQPVREEGRRHAQGVLSAHALAQLRVKGFHHRVAAHAFVVAQADSSRTREGNPADSIGTFH